MTLWHLSQASGTLARNSPARREEGRERLFDDLLSKLRGECEAALASGLLLHATSANELARAIETANANKLASAVGTAITPEAARVSELVNAAEARIAGEAAHEYQLSPPQPHQVVTSQTPDIASIRSGTLPVLIAGQLVELEIWRRSRREPTESGRLVMTLNTQSSGPVRAEARMLGKSLAVTFIAPSVNAKDNFTTVASEIGDLAIRLGCTIESVRYDIQTQEGADMTDTLAAIGTMMQSDADALRLIGQNIANAESVAYRREIPIRHEPFSQLEQKVTTATRPLPQSAVDLTPGTLQSTAAPLNLAIEGNGFFVVSTPEGEALTRRGDFHLDAGGFLVTQSGLAVLGGSGPIRIGSGAVQISPDGTVRSGEEVVGRLRVLEVSDGTRLESSADGLYRVPADHADETGASMVRQGFLETANVQSVNEMIHLMETMRRFETEQKLAHAYDSMLDQAINTLGKV